MSDPRTRAALASLHRDLAAWCARAPPSTPHADWARAASDFLRHAATIEAGRPPTAPPPGPPRPALSLTPARSARLLLLVRHGQAAHNAGDAVTVDPWLTGVGRGQATALAARCRGVDLVVASPQARALQTAALAFGERGGVLTTGRRRRGGRGGGGGGGDAAAGLPLMLAKPPARPPVHPRPGVRYVAHAGLREVSLGLPSDAVGEGTPAAFPGWARVDGDAPPPPSPEPAAAAGARAASFLTWLAARPEPRVAVVSHGGLLSTLLSAFGHEHGPLATPAFRTPFALGEARAFVLTDWNGAAAVAEWW